MLISPWQLCLAHHCEKHGPTPLMVTEGLPVPCSTCFEEVSSHSNGSTGRPHSSACTSGAASSRATEAISEALRQVDLGGLQRSASVPASQPEANAHRATLLRTAQRLAPANGAAVDVDVDTPPLSPRFPVVHAASNVKASSKPRLESGFHKTYDDSATRRAGPCENCALTLPRRHKAKEDGDAATASQPKSGPTMRSRLPCAKVYGTERLSSAASQTSSSAASDDESPTGRELHRHHRSGTAVSTNSQSSTSSSSRGSPHIHYLDYTSTHEPLAPSSFSVVRASCLRTLSFETLPRTPPVGATSGVFGMSTPGSISPSVPGFITTHSAGSAVSGGPIFFGDATAGYTTAFIFRIPDLHARGHKRVYAFLALNTHSERQAMKTFGFVAGAFHDMAAWIQTLAEAEAERAAAAAGARDDTVTRAFLSAATSPSTMPLGLGYGSSGAAGSRAQILPDSLVGNGNTMMGVGGSSFLNSSRRAMTAGFGGGGVALKQRGLAELVGKPDIFLELHTRFVHLLLELGVVLAS